MKRSPITTHVLDTAAGKPAKGIPVTLMRRTFLEKNAARLRGDQAEYVEVEWEEIARAKTDSDGRLTQWLPNTFKLRRGVYEIIFEIDAYLKKSFYPEARVVFEVSSTKRHYHIPLLLSPYGYSTYRGS